MTTRRSCKSAWRVCAGCVVPDVRGQAVGRPQYCVLVAAATRAFRVFKNDSCGMVRYTKNSEDCGEERSEHSCRIFNSQKSCRSQTPRGYIQAYSVPGTYIVVRNRAVVSQPGRSASVNAHSQCPSWFFILERYIQILWSGSERETEVDEKSRYDRRPIKWLLLLLSLSSH